MTGLKDISETIPRYRMDKAFYDRVKASPKRKLVDKFTIPPHSGRGAVVKGGQAFRVVNTEGPQVGDVALWNAHNYKEQMSSARTWQMAGYVIRPFSRVWSDAPWLRPMVTCTEDTVVTLPKGSDFHHHFAQTHCCTEFMEARTGRPGLNSCHLNLLQAIEPFGLKEENIRDNLNVFNKFRIDQATGKVYGAGADSKPGDFIEFYAEFDLLVAISNCPNGDGSVHYASKILPLDVEIYDTGITPQVFPGWTDWRPNWRGQWVEPEG